MVAWNIVLSIGIGLAFAAMPNLIFDAVPQSETGEATGFNTLVRSVGASLGSQIAAAILTGSVDRRRRAAVRRRLHDRVPRLRRRSRSSPRSSRSRSRASATRRPSRRGPRARPSRRSPSDDRRAPHPRRRRPQLRAGARGRLRGARGEGRRGRRAGDRRARRRRQGHGLPLLPDQGAPRLGGARASGCAGSPTRAARGGRAPRRVAGVRASCCCDSAERQAARLHVLRRASRTSRRCPRSRRRARRCTRRWTR